MDLEMSKKDNDPATLQKLGPARLVQAKGGHVTDLLAGGHEVSAR